MGLIFSCRWFLNQAGIITLMEMMQQPDTSLRMAAMQLLLRIVAEDTPVLESLCLVGMLPIVNRLTAIDCSAKLRSIAASFVERLCATSAHTVQMFVACGGIPVLVGVCLRSSLRMCILAAASMCQALPLLLLTLLLKGTSCRPYLVTTWQYWLLTAQS